MKLGQQALEALQAEITGRLKPGEDLVVAGEIGISGTLVLISREKVKLRKYFSESFLYMSEDTLQKCKVSREDDFWMDKRISALYFTEEGGILSGLWKMAEASATASESVLCCCSRYSSEILCRFSPVYLLSVTVLLLRPSGRVWE